MHAAALTFLKTMKPKDIIGKCRKGLDGSSFGGITGRVRSSTGLNNSPFRLTNLQCMILKSMRVTNGYIVDDVSMTLKSTSGANSPSNKSLPHSHYTIYAKFI